MKLGEGLRRVAIPLAITFTAIGFGAIGCADAKPTSPPQPSPSPEPKSMPSATEKKSPTTSAGPTENIPKRNLKVNFEISTGIKNGLDPQTLARIQSDLTTYSNLYKCVFPRMEIVTVEETQGNPERGQIMLDLDSISETERATGISENLLLRSTILQLASLACIDTDNFQEKTYMVDGVTIITKPGLRFNFINPNGVERENTAFPQAVSGALGGYIRQGKFATTSASEAKMTLLTLSLLENQQNAQQLNDLMFKGDFLGFIAFIRGRSIMQINQEDIKAVLDWFAYAESSQNQEELDAVIKEMKEKRGKSLGEKTNFKIDFLHKKAEIKARVGNGHLANNEGRRYIRALKRQEKVREKSIAKRTRRERNKQSAWWLAYMKRRYGAVV
ncbi:hypothetical protein HY345_00885 [Candidatus Microgenomates bacterium]|nr:hypothetical protein [Candidatus Microgenomates bacterium]